MLPDDSRHGTHKGVPAHRSAGTPPCEPCRIANRIYQRRQRKIRAMYGSLLVDATGSRRRVQALMRLGWSAVAISARLEMDPSNLLNAISRPTDQIQGKTAKRIAAVYDEMSMSLPPTTTANERISVSRTQRLAERRGWPPPLAWDDIDRDEHAVAHAISDDLDPVVVERILAGDMTLARHATKPERTEVVARWPGSLKELGRLSGWRTHRYAERAAS